MSTNLHDSAGYPWSVPPQPAYAPAASASPELSCAIPNRTPAYAARTGHDGGVPRAAAGLHRFKLSPGYRLTFTADPIYSTRGLCRIAVNLRNNGPVDAHYPFLCLPLLGLTLEPARGWRTEDVTALRRMRRFSPLGISNLPVGGEAHCCNIVLAVRLASDGDVEYEAGTRHPLSHLPDLRLTVVTGAGNYPSERLPLVAPGAEILRFFAESAERGEVPRFVP